MGIISKTYKNSLAKYSYPNNISNEKQIGCWLRIRKSVMGQRFSLICSIKMEKGPFLIVQMSVGARLLCLYLGLMNSEMIVAPQMDVHAVVKQVQRMMGLAIWCLTMAINYISL